VSEAKELLQEIRANPQLREELAAALLEHGDPVPPDWWSDRARPFLAGLSSAAVVMLAFLVPSMQDLWDRFETRRAVARYAQIGQDLMSQHQYTAAEAAFDRALELAGTQRLDLIQLKMQAHVQRMDEDKEWPGSVPESLTESDFLYALAIDAGPEKVLARAKVLGAYGTYLAQAERWPEAEQRLRQALELSPESTDLHLWLPVGRSRPAVGGGEGVPSGTEARPRQCLCALQPRPVARRAGANRGGRAAVSRLRSATTHKFGWTSAARRGPGGARQDGGGGPLPLARGAAGSGGRSGRQAPPRGDPRQALRVASPGAATVR